MFRTTDRTERTITVHCRTENKTKYPANLVIQFGSTYLTRFDTLKIRICKIIIVVSIAGTTGKSVRPTAELQIKSVGDCLIGIMSSTPVAHHDTVESPFAFQDIVQQIFIVTAMLVLVQIIRSHDAPGMSFLNSRLKGRKINLVKRTVVDYNIRCMTIYFVVVQCKMFYASSYSIALDPTYIRYHHLTRQIRIFAHILEVTSVQRRTIDVHTRSQQDRLITIAGLFTDAFAIKQRHIRIPRCCQTSQGRESHTRVVGPSCLIPFIPQHFGPDTVRAVRTPDFRNTQTGYSRTAELRLSMNHSYFFLQSHT